MAGKPLDGFPAVGANHEDFLHSSGAEIKAFKAGGGLILELELSRAVSAADLDSAGDDAGDEWALLDDAIENGVEAFDATVLAFDAAEFHKN